MAGRSINIFLPDTAQKGFRIATIPNWAGSVLTASESQLAALLQRPEANRHGCYIFMSGDRFDGDAVVYIGQTYDLKSRLKQHDSKGRSWERIAFVSTSDSSFSESHFLYIEAQMIADANNSSSIVLENGNSGRISRGNLGEAQEADAESFLENVKFLLPVIGFDIFKRANKQLTSSMSKSEAISLVLPRKRKTVATGSLEDGILTVLRGSKVVPFSETVSSGYKKLRDNLIESGVIKIDPDGSGVFTEDYEFKSPSAASGVIFGRNDNSRMSWKLSNNESVSLGDALAKNAEKEAA
jgi:hypothetical protein